MTDRIQVREAVEEDGVAIGEAHAASWLTAYTDIFNADFLAAAAESRRTGWPRKIRGDLSRPELLLVGAWNSRVVAFAHSVAVPTSGAAEITGFYCHPDAWGTGVSVALMAETKRTLAVNFGQAFLWTLRDATRARRFYEKMGFDQSRKRRNQALTDWSTGETVERPAVEYSTVLSDV